MSEGQDEKKRKRIDLSMSQVVGGGLATLTAATAASYLGVYGTIIGAAVMSVISTAGTAVVQHFLSRSGDKARDFAGRAHLTRNRRPEPRSATEELRAAGPGRVGDADTLLAATTEIGETSAERDDPATRVLPTVGDAAPTTVFPATGRTEGHDATELLATGRKTGAARPDAPDGEFPDERVDRGGPDSRTWWRRKEIIIPAVGIFLLVMAVITAFELFSGRTLTATVHGQDGRSAPSLLGGNAAQSTEETPSQETGPDTGIEDQQEPTGQPTTAPTEAPGGQGGPWGQQDESTDPTAPATPGDEGDPTGAPTAPGSGETGDGTSGQDGQGGQDGQDGLDGGADEGAGGGGQGSGAFPPAAPQQQGQPVP
ncbi:hypothetical protein ACQEU5_17565 [Marinactinospora thermotolerans]|uniref:Uncharacterized protein n=1 Tax=Marinactinospora thermotolerans DSM 45154 TaxID=1122192 RepID=A0A1T4S5C7_9ACTN|nr:hypothetical protein [Marinactinospora thermotolerans]SKA23424.1 hypothetical protein SAMN02745673_03217 [Marinactinospora thermotolerans DSM 45154]